MPIQFWATWQPIAKHDGTRLPHAMLRLPNGKELPGRYSELSHTWQAYNEFTGYMAVQPTHYVDLIRRRQSKRYKKRSSLPRPTPDLGTDGDDGLDVSVSNGE